MVLQVSVWHLLFKGCVITHVSFDKVYLFCKCSFFRSNEVVVYQNTRLGNDRNVSKEGRSSQW